MNRAAPAVPWYLARLLLIACTAIGVAALHTLGHATASPDGHSIGRLIAAQAGPVVVAQAGTVAVAQAGTGTGTVAVALSIRPAGTDDDGCAGDGCTHEGALPDNGREPWHGWEVCLAILSVLATLLAVAVLRPVGIVRLGPPAGRWRLTSGPMRPPVGLALASTAVLRT